MEQSLNDVRLLIERIQASIASMEGKVAFSKIDFSIRQPIVIQVAEAPGFLS
ncbi:MAG: hypothetical protein HRT74_08955 [Flavobacteriales bacterium]|nr:hypothetical protein [Flavobacteriales bacterium]